MEVIKAFLQVAVIAPLGGIVSLLAQEFNREREKRETLKAFRRTLLGQLVQVYRETKKARRLLRAKPDSLRFYDQQMSVINDLELDLETLVEKIETTEQAFPGGTVARQIDRMAGYLNLLIDEYEKSMPRLSNEPSSISLHDLPYLNEFLRPTKDGTTSFEYGKLYRETLISMRKVILE